MHCRSEREELGLDLLDASERGMDLTCCASDTVQNSIHGNWSEIRDRVLNVSFKMVLRYDAKRLLNISAADLTRENCDIRFLSGTPAGCQSAQTHHETNKQRNHMPALLTYTDIGPELQPRSVNAIYCTWECPLYHLTDKRRRITPN
jgi:hypothetical protein